MGLHLLFPANSTSSPQLQAPLLEVKICSKAYLGAEYIYKWKRLSSLIRSAA